MRRAFTVFCTTMGALSGPCLAEIVPVWSTGVAVPGEQVVLYLVETQEDAQQKQDIFQVDKAPTVKNAKVDILQLAAGANPLDPDRRMVEVQPIMFKADMAGEISPEPIEVTYQSGRKATVTVPPLKVRPTGDIKWFAEPVPYGVLWHTNVNDGYVHQPVQAAVKIFMRSDCNTPLPPQLSSVGVKVGNFHPAVEGIVAQLQGRYLPDPQAYARGQTWRTADFAGAFTPFREGNNDVVGKILMRQQRGIFSVAQEELPIAPLTISALPLPPGAPADFADTVGQYTISATTQAKDLAANEAVEVEITVRGSGNLEQLPTPKPEDELNWRLVPATRKPILGANGETVGMIFSQLMRPTAEVGGLPAFSFSYFDPEEMAYRTAATKPIPLTWRETEDAGSGLVSAPAAEPPPAGTVPVATLTDIYHFLPNAAAGGNGPELQLPKWLIYLLYLPGIGIFLWLLGRVLTRRIAAGSANRAREKELKAITAHSDGLAFLKGLGAFVESHIPPQAQSEAVRAILTRRDTEAFLPGAAPEVTPSERQRMLRAVRKALAGMSTAIVLLLSMLPQAQAAEDKAEAAYTAGQFSKALELLQEEQEKGNTQRNTAELLCNMGNCYYRLGKPGTAALYYTRALQNDPGLAEAEANLGFIQRREGAILPTRSNIDRVFTLLSSNDLWILTHGCAAALLLCIALQVLRRHHSRPWLHACTATAAILCLLCAADRLYYSTRDVPEMSSLPPTELAIVTTATTARSAAADSAPSIVELTPSTPLHLLAIRGSYSYVQTFTGVRGWVSTADISPVAQSDAKDKGRPIIIRLQ
ncbi:MAG: BatD family protein [Akkermansia sp.]|nr:BatD family protein [Akkermansia sp.]